MAVNIGTISKSRPTTCYTMQRPAPTAERRESNGVTFASSSACNWSLLLQHVRTGCALYSCFGYSRSERAEANKQWKWLRKSGQNRKCVKLNLCKMIRFDFPIAGIGSEIWGWFERRPITQWRLLQSNLWVFIFIQRPTTAMFVLRVW